MYLVIVVAFALLLTDGLPPAGWNLVHRLARAYGFSSRESAATWAIALGQIGLVGLIALVLARRTRAARDGTPDGDLRVEERYTQSGMVLTGALMALVPLVYLCTSWLPLVRALPVLRQFALLADLAALAPFLVTIFVVWIIQFSAERVVRGIVQESVAPPDGQPPAAWTLGVYLAYKTRHQLLTIMAPMLAVLAAKHALDHYRTAIVRAVRVPWAPDALIGFAAAIVLVISPVMLRYLWVTRPLPAGPLRARLEGLCRRVGLRYSEILVWESQGLVVNAAVMGLIPPVRYVLLSDGLLAAMSELQIEAVFGHEAGHVRRHHLLYFGVFALLSMLLVGGLLEFLARAVGLSPSVLQLVALGAMLVIWGGAFGYVSRKFERQADLYGAQCVTEPNAACEPGCGVHGNGMHGNGVDGNGVHAIAMQGNALPGRGAHVAAPCDDHAAQDDLSAGDSAACAHRASSAFAARGETVTQTHAARPTVCIAAARLFGRTLRDVAHLNGIPVEAPSWRHGSVQSRCELLHRFAGDPRAVRKFERGVWWMKTLMALLTAVGSAIACWLYWPF